MIGIKYRFWPLVLIAGLSQVSSSAHALTDCDFIQLTMNKLGSRMSILRIRIASSDNPKDRSTASELLRSHTHDYRLAK